MTKHVETEKRYRYQNQIRNRSWKSFGRFIWNYMPEQIENPSHYGGKNNPHEAIKFINAHELNFNLGNVVKYIVRAGKKDPNAFVQDLKKACFYLNHEIEKHEKK